MPADGKSENAILRAKDLLLDLMTNWQHHRQHHPFGPGWTLLASAKQKAYNCTLVFEFLVSIRWRMVAAQYLLENPPIQHCNWRV